MHALFSKDKFSGWDYNDKANFIKKYKCLSEMLKINSIHKSRHSFWCDNQASFVWDNYILIADQNRLVARILGYGISNLWGKEQGVWEAEVPQ